MPSAAAVGTLKRPRAVAAVIGAVLFGLYLSNLRVLSSGDNIPTRLLPFSIVRNGNLTLDEFPRLRQDDGSLFYYVREQNGHLYSGTPFLTALIVTPLYIVPSWVLSASGIPYDDVRAQLVFVVMERLTAAALTAFSAALLFLVLLRLASVRWALALALIYGVGTSTWRFSGQALWTHVFSELALVILCALFVRRDPQDEPGPVALLFAGLILAVAVGNRPPMVIFALVTTIFVWNHHRRRFVAFALLPVLGGTVLAAYNVSTFRSIAGGYGQVFSHFSGSLLTGVTGLLFSPNRGLFIFTPILVFSVWGAIRVWRDDAPAWMRYLSIGLLLHLLLYAKFDQWWAGYAFGPRYFTDVAPVLCLLLLYGLRPICRTPAATAACGLLALYGVGVQAIGVYCDDENWNRLPVQLELSPERVWDWSDLHIVRALRSGWHGGNLLPLLIGAFRDPAPARLEPALRGEDLAAQIVVAAPPTRLRYGVPHALLASVTNLSGRVWPCFAADYSTRGLVVLVVRWWANGQPLFGAGGNITFPKNVGPDEEVRVPVTLNAPQPGRYEVELLVVQAHSEGGGLSSGAASDTFRFPVVVN